MLLLGITIFSVLAAAVFCGASGAFGGLNWLWMLPVSFAGAFLAGLVLAFLFLLAVCAPVKLDRPQEKDSKFYRTLTNVYVEAVIRILRIRLRVEGLEKLPKDGRYLLVCNHQSNLDPLVLLHVFRKSQLAFISKRENNNMFIVGKLMHKFLCQPINRENDREALKTILKCVQLIKEDMVSVAVFPEGYTSKDALLRHFRSGVFKIAQKANVPIVVCTLRNTRKIFPNILHLRPTEVPLHLVEVIPAEELKGVTAVDIGDRIYRLMADDLGPENVLQEESPQNT